MTSKLESVIINWTPYEGTPGPPDWSDGSATAWSTLGPVGPSVVNVTPSSNRKTRETDPTQDPGKS
jgi:hypothetical protein